MELVVFILIPLVVLYLCRKGVKKIRDKAIDGKPKGWAKARESLLTIVSFFIIVYFLLFLVGGMGMTWVGQIPMLLAFGWILFIIEKFPDMVFNWDGIVLSIGGLIVLVIGGHAFMKWLYGHWGMKEETSDAPPAPKKEWKPAWTGGVVVMLFVMFGASIGLIGATHQTAWMFKDKESFFRSSWRFRYNDSDSKSNLHNIYLGCKAVWAEKGSDVNCDLATVSSAEYGYVQSKKVVVRLGGKENNFHAIAGHLDSEKWYWMDPSGQINEIKEEILAPPPNKKANDYGY